MKSRPILGATVAMILAWVGCSGEGEGSESLHSRLWDLRTEALDLRDAGRHEDAVASLSEMAALDPQNPWPYDLAARIHAIPPRFDEAEQLMRSWGPPGPGLTYGLALIDFRERRSEAALEGLENALETYRSTSNLAGQAFSLQSMGMVHRVEGRLDEAEQFLQEARILFVEMDDEASIPSVLVQLSMVERQRKRHDAAMGLLEEALEIQTRFEDLRGQGHSWYNMSLVLSGAKEYDRAIEAAEKSAVLRRAHDPWNLYPSLLRLARLHKAVGRDDLALEPLLEAAEDSSAKGKPDREYARRKEAGQILSEAGRHREALEQLELARSAAREAGTERRRASVEAAYCIALRRAGRYAAAIDLAEETADFAAQHDLPVYEASALTTKANALRSVGRLREALLAQQRALELYESLEKPAGVFTSLQNLAALHHYLGDANSAMQYLEQILEFTQELSQGKTPNRSLRVYEAEATHGIGVILAEQDRLSDARENQLAALEAWDSLSNPGEAAHIKLSMANLELKENHPEKAREWMGDALTSFRSVGDREGECYALNIKAKILSRQGRHDEALAASAEALALAQEFELRRAIRIGHGFRAAVHEDAGQFSDALAEYRRAIEVMEAQRAELGIDEFKTSFFTNTAEAYERSVDLQARIERAEDPAAPRAFRLAERARARGLLDLLAESAASLRQQLPSELVKREQSLADQMSAAEVRRAGADGPEELARADDELEAAETALERFKLELRDQAPEYAQVVYPDSVELSVLQNDVLRDDETLLRYFFGPERALVWVVSREESRFFELGSSEEITALVDRFLARASNPGSGLAKRPEGEGLAEELAAKLLVGPLPSGHRLLVVSDGPLLRLPFEVLKRDDRYLVEDHEIVAIPSASVLGLMRDAERDHAPGGFLGLGDPVEPADEASFPRLPASAQALDRIAELFPAQTRVTLEQESCTKRALRGQALDRFRFVHFATHGWLISENPPRIGLRLSPESKGGPASFLSMDDVFPLNLSAELVVLSGCQTGLGELLPGEGLVGLTRAFLYAGSRSVLVSLWNVSDRSTAEFMEAFYKALDGRTVPEALRQARLTFLRSDRPAQRQFYRWAPFVLVGDPGTTTVELNPDPNLSKKGRDGGR